MDLEVRISWISQRRSIDDEWEAPINLGESINSTFADDNASLSADGLIMVFESDRPGGVGYDDIWMVTRPSLSEPWSTPVNLGEPVNSTSYEFGPAISSDGLSIVFISGKGGHSELWETSRSSRDAPWSPPRNLGPQINSPAFQGWATLASDGLSMLYNSLTVPRVACGTDVDLHTGINGRRMVGSHVPAPNEQRGVWSPCLSGDNTIMMFD